MKITDTTQIGTIKSQSLKILKKCWVETAFIMVIYTAIFFFIFTVLNFDARLLGLFTYSDGHISGINPTPEFISSALLIFSVTYAVSSPFYYGVKWFFSHAAEGTIMPISSIFACYATKHTVIRILKLRFRVLVNKALILLLLSIPMAAFIFAAYNITDGFTEEAHIKAISVGIVVLFLILFVLYTMLTLKYVPTSYVLAWNPDMRTNSIIRKSKQIIKGKYRSLSSMYHSFGGWMILIILTIFPILFVIPYMEMATAVFMNSIGTQDIDEKAELQ